MTKRTGLIVGTLLALVGLLGLMSVFLLGAAGPGGLVCPGGGLCFGGSNGTGSGGTADGGSGVPSDSVRSFDAMFIAGMVPHHEDAIAMAELALTRAEHPELKELAQTIIDTQSAEVDQMKEWYREWYGEDVPTRGTFGMMGGRGRFGQAADLTALEAADPFDAEFIRQMIPHHQMGIMMARMAGRSSSHPEIQGLADDIIQGQSAEIEQMRAWYDEWYDN